MAHHAGSAANITLGHGSVGMSVGVGYGCFHIIESEMKGTDVVQKTVIRFTDHWQAPRGLRIAFDLCRYECVAN